MPIRALQRLTSLQMLGLLAAVTLAAPIPLNPRPQDVAQDLDATAAADVDAPRGG